MDAKNFTQLSSDYERIERAILYLEQNFRNQPSLEEVAQSVHLSKYHFQRLFKRWAGISPKQFLQFLTIEYAKKMLAESSTILDTTLEAGLSSPSRLHDLFITFEAITPGEFKDKGAGLKIVYGFHETPFGRCLLATTPRGICSLVFVAEGQEEQALAELKQGWPNSEFGEEPDQTQPLVNRIFTPSADEAPLNLVLKGTNFQVKVWEALLRVPPGAMVSYHDIAAYIGQPSASRAVAQAIGQNPIAYIIPCHRVIRKMGIINDYRWGASRKKAILGWEASLRTASPQGLLN
jgi:AraC family transcriptional regulator, regulatory protein of adaptative response / methylated-DNA-[protein]-cysteine methyltransferase